MKIKKVNFYYFSGTGNTLHVVKAMQQIFLDNGVEVKLHRIEKTSPAEIDLNSTVGLACPVAVQSTYPFVWEFIRALPISQGTEVFMVDTLAGFSGAIVGPVKKALLRKGYNTIGAHEIIMPSNFFASDSNEKNKKRIEKGMVKAKQYAQDIVDSKTRWGRTPILSDLLFQLCPAREIPWRWLRKTYFVSVDKSKCSKCGLCSKLCPTGNIVMEEYPIVSDKCQLCMRCVSFCPTEAINMGKTKFKGYHAVEAGELLR